jgi:hypothetical protein
MMKTFQERMKKRRKELVMNKFEGNKSLDESTANSKSYTNQLQRVATNNPKIHRKELHTNQKPKSALNLPKTNSKE